MGKRTYVRTLGDYKKVLDVRRFRREGGDISCVLKGGCVS